MLDTDKSGRLDRDEFMAMMEMENDHKVEGEMANMTAPDIGDLLANSIGDMMTAGTAGADDAAAMAAAEAKMATDAAGGW